MERQKRFGRSLGPAFDLGLGRWSRHAQQQPQIAPQEREKPRRHRGRIAELRYF